MSNIKNTIRKNMYSSMKEHNDENKRTYSLALQAIEKKEKDAQRELSDEEIIPIIQKEIKEYNETKEFAQKTNKFVTVRECENAISLLAEFLPQQLTEDEIKSFLLANTTDIDWLKKNKGAIMKRMSALKGKADMKLVNQIVDSYLV